MVSRRDVAVDEARQDVELEALDELRVAAAKAGARCLQRANYSKLGYFEKAVLRKVVDRLLAQPHEPLTDEVRWTRKPRSKTEGQSISRALRTLERRGLIQRIAADGAPGTPVRWVRLTIAGLAAVRGDRKALQKLRRAA